MCHPLHPPRLVAPPSAFQPNSNPSHKRTKTDEREVTPATVCIFSSPKAFPTNKLVIQYYAIEHDSSGTPQTVSQTIGSLLHRTNNVRSQFHCALDLGHSSKAQAHLICSFTLRMYVTITKCQPSGASTGSPHSTKPILRGQTSLEQSPDVSRYTQSCENCPVAHLGCINSAQITSIPSISSIQHYLDYYLIHRSSSRLFAISRVCTFAELVTSQWLHYQWCLDPWLLRL